MLSDFDSGATVAVKDLEVARNYYEGILGFAPAAEVPEGVLYSSGSGRFLVYQSGFAGSNKATYIGFTVPDDKFDGEVSALMAKGITLDTFDVTGWEGASWEDGVLMADGGKSAWFRDPDGNILNITTMP